jgi:hypothetical protein
MAPPPSLPPAAFGPPARVWMQRGLLEASRRLVPCGRTVGAPQPPLLFWSVGGAWGEDRMKGKDPDASLLLRGQGLAEVTFLERRSR